METCNKKIRGTGGWYNKEWYFFVLEINIGGTKTG